MKGVSFASLWAGGCPLMLAADVTPGAQATYIPDPYVQARLQVSRDGQTWHETNIAACVGQVLYCRAVDPTSGTHPPPEHDWDTRIQDSQQTLAQDGI